MGMEASAYRQASKLLRLPLSSNGRINWHFSFSFCHDSGVSRFHRNSWRSSRFPQQSHMTRVVAMASATTLDAIRSLWRTRHWTSSCQTKTRNHSPERGRQITRKGFALSLDG